MCDFCCNFVRDFNWRIMVSLQHINKSFGKQQVLRDVTLDIPAGQVVGLLGPNGAGKSTLMKIMIGLWTRDKGQGNVQRDNVQCTKDDVRSTKDKRGSEQGVESKVIVPERIGYLPENNPLYEDMYVAEYLRFMAGITHYGSKKKNDELVDALIERVGLTPERHKHIRELSKGYRQRVGLAQALIGDPQLLILDEPTTGLDPNQLVEIRSLIRSLGKDRTVILSTHIMQEVREMCDRVVIIDHGEIKADKKTDEIEDLEQLFREKTGGRE